MIKIISYNINGFTRITKVDKNNISLLNKDPKQTSLHSFFKSKIEYNLLDCLSDCIISESPDIICLQEIKNCNISNFNSYNWFKLYPYFRILTSTNKAYSGVAIFSKIKPIDIIENFGTKSTIFDNEARLLTFIFSDFILINTYVPNTTNKLRIPMRLEFENLIIDYIKSFNVRCIYAGDLNVTLNCNFSINIPGSNKEFKKCFERLCNECNLIDTYIGTDYSHIWGKIKSRLDAFLISKDLCTLVISNDILTDYCGSDHKPIQLKINIQQSIKVEEKILNDNLNITVIKDYYNKKLCKNLFNDIMNSGDFKHSNITKKGLLSKKRNKIIYGNIPNYTITYLGKKIITNVINWDKQPLIKQLANDCSKITKEDYNICVIQYYNNGLVGIKPHKDKEMKDNTHIISLSLGETRIMSFKKDNKNIDIPLEEGTLCIINPPTNDFWLHSIPTDKSLNPRISIIFRKI